MFIFFKLKNTVDEKEKKKNKKKKCKKKITYEVKEYMEIQ